MKLEDPGGQLLILRLDDNRWSGSRERVLRAAQPSGVLLSAPLPHSAELTSELLHNIAGTLSHQPFLAVAEEGGPQDPLRRFLPGVPSPQAAARMGLSAVTRLGELIGVALSLLGFNTNFAPLLDLATPSTEESLGVRTFSSDPRQVAQCGAAFLTGLRRHKILACGKHFPGLGSLPNSEGRRASENPAVVDKPMAALWHEDLLPYRELLPSLPMVLVSPAAYKAYDFDQPRAAALSPRAMEGLLRIKLGYRGLALAYELESKEVRGTLNFGEAAIQALNAGCDLLVVEQESSFEAARRALEAGLESGKLSTQRVEEALERVRTAKKGLKPPTGAISRRALEELTGRFEIFAKEYRHEEWKIA